MFAPGRLYRHEKMTTVAVEVIKSFYVKEKKVWKIKVRWWNIGSKHKPWCMSPSDGSWDQRIEIPNIKLHEWKHMGFGDYGPAPQHKELSFEQGRIRENSFGE